MSKFDFVLCNSNLYIYISFSSFTYLCVRILSYTFELDIHSSKYISALSLGGVLVWLLRGLVCRSQHEPGGKAVLITGCDTGIGHEVARHLDMLGLWVFAGCENTASEGAQRLRVEASSRPAGSQDRRVTWRHWLSSGSSVSHTEVMFQNSPPQK